MLFYKRIERTSQPTIFLHGFLGSHKDAKAFCESEFISWHLIDLPGHGNTKQSATFEHLKYYLDNLKSPFHLVGYSLGGRVAQKLASHPSCLSLSLLSSHTIFTNEQLQTRKQFEQVLKTKLKELDYQEFLNQFYQSTLFTSLRRKKRLFESFLIQRQDQDKNDLLFALEELGIGQIQSQLPSCPILGLYGMLDLNYQKLYTLLPEKVHVVTISHAGHSIILENPKECLKVLETFIKRVEHDKLDLMW